MTSYSFKVLYTHKYTDCLVGMVAIKGDDNSLLVYMISQGNEGTDPHILPWTGYFGIINRPSTLDLLPMICEEMRATEPTPSDHDSRMRAAEKGFTDMEEWYGSPIYPLESTAVRSI